MRLGDTLQILQPMPPPSTLPWSVQYRGVSHDDSEEVQHCQWPRCEPPPRDAQPEQHMMVSPDSCSVESEPATAASASVVLGPRPQKRAGLAGVRSTSRGNHSWHPSRMMAATLVKPLLVLALVLGRGFVLGATYYLGSTR